jgi:hypothetical protein
VSRREAWLSAGLVFVVALVIRAWAATQTTFPRPEDTAYYVDVAGNVLAGRGLTTDAIWSYGTPPLSFPRPAFEVWLPMATVLDLVPMALLGGLLGSAFAAAQVASILVGSVVAVLAWRLAADIAADRGLSTGRARTLALGTGLAAAVYLPLVLFSVQPDSTMPFAALVLGAVLVMRRAADAAAASGIAIAAVPEERRPRFSRKPPSRHARRRHVDGAGYLADAQTQGGATGPSGLFGLLGLRGLDRTLGRWLALLGLVLGLAALTRNEAIWLALAWVIVAWSMTRPAGSTDRRFRAALPLIAVPAAVSIAVFAPWAIRDWLTFGSPLPGQALSNALFLDGRDVFAWANPPTLERYLGAGLGTLVGLRVTGFLHNLGSVLLLLGVPISAVGLIALPWIARGPALRSLVAFSLTTFLVATLVFPVATTWGTFLHAAGAIHVLVLVSALLALDWLIQRVGEARSWTRPVAWLGATLAVGGSLLLTSVLLPVDAAAGHATASRYAALPGALSTAGAPLPSDGSPVISDFPIWLAAETGVHAIALPNESPADILDLAQTFDAGMLIVDANTEGQWRRIFNPETLGAECFQPVPLPSTADDALADLRAFRIVCYKPPTPGQP